MGLDVSHNAFSGAYGAFNRFRTIVCKAAGGSFPPHEDAALDRNSFYVPDECTRKTAPGLYEFLGHSDCDGEIDPQTCKLVADELEALLPKIEELAQTTPAGEHIEREGGYVAVTKKFIEGCRAAHANNENLYFG